DEANPVAIRLHDFGLEDLVYASADRTFEIVEVDDGHLCVGISPNWPSKDVDGVTGVSLIQIETFDSRHRFVVFRDQKLKIS
ncbi:MAG: hypothetical protein WAN28_16080, partial [Terracidiphilus sp.]